MEFFSFVLCLRRQLYLEIKEQVHEIDERSKEQVKKKGNVFCLFFFLVSCLFLFCFCCCCFFFGGGVEEDFGKFRAIFLKFIANSITLMAND